MAYIRLMGSGNERINGNGAYLHTMCSGDVTVNGDLQSVTYMSCGDLTVHGNVLQSVKMMGSGNVKIDGSVNGIVCHLGSGDLRIRGDVYGDIVHMGMGQLIVDGVFYGKTKTQMGTGRITLRGKPSHGFSPKPTSTGSKENRPTSGVSMEEQSNQNVCVDTIIQIDKVHSGFKKPATDQKTSMTVSNILVVLIAILVLWKFL